MSERDIRRLPALATNNLTSLSYNLYEIYLQILCPVKSPYSYIKPTPLYLGWPQWAFISCTQEGFG